MLLTLAITLTLADVGDFFAALPRFIGRTHPMVVHFPIALLTVAAIVEVVRVAQRRTLLSPTVLICLLFATFGSALSVTAGWLNASNEPHSGVEDLMETHRWVGIAAGVLSLLGLALYWCAMRKPFPAGRGLRAAATMVIIVGAGVVGLAGHLGGSITYGENYLFSVFSKKPVAVKPPAIDPTLSPPPPALPPAPPPSPADGSVRAIEFVRDVQPIFTARCIECHGPDKVKGGLRLDSLAEIFKEDPSKWAVVPGNTAESEIVIRVELPTDDDDHMPSKGGPLTPVQIQAIKAWIAGLPSKPLEPR